MTVPSSLVKFRLDFCCFFLCHVDCRVCVMSCRVLSNAKPIFNDVTWLNKRYLYLYLNVLLNKLIRYHMILYDVIWCDVLWRDMIWCAVMWCDIWYDTIWYDTIWYDVIRYDTIWYDVMWCDVMWCDIVWYDIVSSYFSLGGGPTTRRISIES